ncbi:MAG: ISAs1 family transposase [Simkaniaceae bacterium]|nr:MAG: ISAs1 family transposase [Simkaniaceae bacterium]
MLGTEDFSSIAFLDFFTELEDPRLERRKLYPLDEILLTTLCAKICDAESWEDIQDFGEAKIGFLRKYLAYKNGIPSHDTFARVFSLLDPKQFKTCFIEWMRGLELQSSEVISIDGKTLRGSFDKGDDQKAIHMVSAFASNARLVLGQEKVSEKSNEITAIPKLLDALFITGGIVTIDAMGCQKSIASKIREKKADYVLSLTGNHGDLHDDVRTYFEGTEKEGLEIDEECDKGHGRIEVRRCSICRNIDWLTHKEEWKDLNCIVEIESLRTEGGKGTKEKRYYLSSLKTSAKEVAKAIRSHWSIENSLHWVLDVTFNEDRSQIRKKHGPENMAIVKHTVLNLLRQNGDEKTSLKRRRRRASYSEDYLADILQKKF